MKRILLVLSVMMFSGLAFAQPELAGNPDELREFLYPTDKVVTISGAAEEKAYSDTAIVHVVVTTKNKLLSAAMSENSELRNDLSKLLVDAGIQRDSIKSSKFSSSPQYGWFGSKPSNYEVVNRLVIRISQEDQLTEVAKVVDQYENVELSQTEFEHSEKDKFNETVKSQALEKIMKQKQMYEESLGVKLTAIGFREYTIRQNATRGAMMIEEIVVTANKRTSSPKASSSASYAPKQPSFDEIEYTASLSVDFKIN